MALDSKAINKLFATEADQNPQFARDTSVLPRMGETQESLKSALTSEHWLILSGGKGSGKTSYLFLGLRDLPRKMLGVYSPFQTIDTKFTANSQGEIDDFLCKHFYGGLISSLDATIKDSLPGKAKDSQKNLQAMIDALIPVAIEQTKTVKRGKGILARLGLKSEPAAVGLSYGKTIEEMVIERRTTPARPNYEKFRQLLTELIEFLGYESVVFYIDEVNEIRFDMKAITCLFEHIYIAYKTYKAEICFKIAITDTVEEAVPDEILSGNYFEPKNLKSFLLFPKEYEDFIREILEARIKQLGLDINPEQIFTDEGFHILVMTSMGNPREFFLTARQAWETQKGRITQSIAIERAKKVGGDKETIIMQEGGIAKSTYEKLIQALKESDSKKSGDKGSPLGVSYFMIAESDKLSAEVRDSLSFLEKQRIIYSTNSYRALRRKDQKSEINVLSYPICVLKSIRYLDVVKALEQGGTENRIMNLHRAQIRLPAST